LAACHQHDHHHHHLSHGIRDPEHAEPPDPDPRRGGAEKAGESQGGEILNEAMSAEDQ
jgi:hypothetical protein